MENLFGEETLKGGMTAGSNKNLDDIDRWVKPVMNERGFEIEPLRGVEEVRKVFNLARSKEWSEFGKRFIKEGSGNLQKIFQIGNDNVLIAQVYVLNTLSSLGARARFNIPRNIVDSTTTQTRVQETLKALKYNNVYLFVYVKTGWYFFVKFSDVPNYAWHLTYRHVPNRLDRMYIKPEFLERQFDRISNLKQEVQEILVSNIKP